MKNNILAFPNVFKEQKNKTKLTKFQIMPFEWDNLKTKEGRYLSERSRRMLWTIKILAERHRQEEVIIDYKLFYSLCGFRCSERQMRRYLVEISNTGIVTVETKRELFNCQKKLSLKMHFQKLEMALLIDAEDDTSGQICQTELSLHIEDRNNNRNKEEVTIASRVSIGEKNEPEILFKNENLNEVKPLQQYAQKVLITSPTYQKPPETKEEERKYMNAHKFVKRDDEGVVGIGSVLENVFKHAPDITESIKEITEKKQELELMNTVENIQSEEKETMLKQALKENLDPVIAEEIEQKCSFNFTPTDNKIFIKMGGDLEMSEETKQAMKKAIYDIYGEEISITTKDSFAIIRDNIIEKIGNHSYKNWFDCLVRTKDTGGKKVILKGTKFQVNEIKSRYENILKDCLKNSGAESLEIVSDSSNDSIIISGDSDNGSKKDGDVKEFHILWGKFKQAIMNYFPGEKGEFVMSIWFNQLVISHESSMKRLILIGEEKVVNHVTSDYHKALDHVVKIADMDLEIRYFDNLKLPIIYSGKK